MFNEFVVGPKSENQRRNKLSKVIALFPESKFELTKINFPHLYWPRWYTNAVVHQVHLYERRRPIECYIPSRSIRKMKR